MRVRRATLHALELPFRERFVHGTQARAASDAVVVRVEGADGAVGHGEGLARPYVTGETTDGLVARVRDVLWPAVRGAELPAEPAELLGAIDALLPPSAPSGAERTGAE